MLSNNIRENCSAELAVGRAHWPQGETALREDFPAGAVKWRSLKVPNLKSCERVCVSYRNPGPQPVKKRGFGAEDTHGFQMRIPGVPRIPGN